MCNFYIMYYVDGDEALSENYCFTPGPPSWSWDDFDGLDAALAPLSASIVPGTDEFLAATQDMMDDSSQHLDDQLAHLLSSAEHDVTQDSSQHVDNQLARLLSSFQDANDIDDEYLPSYAVPDDLYDRGVNLY